MSEFTLCDGLWEREQYVPLLERTIKIYIMQEGDKSPTGRQLEIVDSINSFPVDFLSAAASHAWDYYQRLDAILKYAKNGGVVFKRDEVSQHFFFKSALIPQIKNCEANFIFLAAHCDWEEEHGMGFLVENGQIIFCGDETSLPFSAAWEEIISSPKAVRDTLLSENLSQNTG
ncbi:MAG: hypothetical protein SGJ19_22325 [Planctomycetia bacterium]|nr:hypothetical protein [Planctomycetia bacterium]